MAVNPTKTTFQTGPDTKVAQVDIYSNSGTSIVQSGTINVDSKLTDAVGDKSKLSNLKPASNKKGLISSQFKNALKDKRKQNAFIDGLRAFSRDPKAFKRMMAGNAMHLTGINKYIPEGWIDNPPDKRDIFNVFADNIPEARLLLETSEKIRDIKDAKSATELINLLADITGNEGLAKVLDIGPQLAMAQNFIDVAFAYGLPEITDAIIETVETVEDRKRLKVASTINAAMHSQVDFIDEQVNDSEIGSGTILARYPNIPSVIVSNYDYQPGKDTVDKEDSTKLVNLINGLSPNWWKSMRDGEEVLDFTLIKNTSNAAKDAFIQNEETYFLALLANEYNEVKLPEHTLSMRPYTPVEVLKVA